MELTFVNDLGQSFIVEIDPDMELENVMALLEAESGIPINQQHLSYDDREISSLKSTMRQLGIPEHDAVLVLRRKVVDAATGSQGLQDSEMMRLQLLGDPNLMRQIQEVQPELAEAAHNNPARFAELLRQTSVKLYEAEMARQLNADPFDVEAQRKIEEAIRRQAVFENMTHALEYSPESFGRVTMLYIPVEVNSHPVKAFVDSGAQTTIMSPECAEACGIMRLVDKDFAGIARGVGTAQILGRVHTAQMKLSDLFLPCSFTIMEGRDVDLLLGLDMLKAHQACIDLEKGVLRIQGREVPFLSEHELPDKAREPREPDLGVAPSASQRPPSHTPSFPGGGHTLGSAPRSQPPGRHTPPAQQHSEDKIQTLIGLGASRELAITLLDTASGNVDMAASLLF